MPVNGKLQAGERLPDWQAPTGTVTLVECVVSGKLPTPIDISSPQRGSMAERCAMYGTSKRSTSKEKE